MKHVKVFMSMAIVSLLLFSTLVIAGDNSPPSTPPQPTGPSVVEVGTLHSWAVGRSYDLDGDYISYLWDWDDGVTYHTYPIDEDFVVASHIYLMDGTYDIQVKSIDFYDAESNWSDPFTVDVLGINISTDKDEYEQNDTGVCTIENTLSDNVSITLISIVKVMHSEPLKGGLDDPFPIILEPGESYDCMFLIENMIGEHYRIWVDYDYNGLPCRGSTDFDIVQPNEPPNTPSTPEGESNGVVGEEYCYVSATTDPNAEDIVGFMFDWGDGNFSNWVTSPEPGPIVITLCHSWEYAGEYDVRVKAKDEHGAESGWSDAKTVSISEDTPPESDILICAKGVGLAIRVCVTNNGTMNLVDVDWNVAIKGVKIFRGIDQSYNCTFDTLDVGATETIRIPGSCIRWIGRVTITVTISYGSDTVSKNINGFILGPFVIIPRCC